MHDVGVREPVHRVELDVATGMSDELVRHGAHRGMLDPEAHDVAELVVVQVAFDRRDERDVQAELGAVVQRLLLGVAQSRPRISVWVRSVNPSNCM